MEGERRRGTVEALIQSAIAVHQCAGELDFLALLVADVTGAIVELHQHTPVIEAFVDHLETVCNSNVHTPSEQHAGMLVVPHDCGRFSILSFQHFFSFGRTSFEALARTWIPTAN